ncbi:MAG: DUF1294 domain-containing protein [Acetatifactor sp.]|nr:DUF1294 domain-containing protein [Acetatifactor sp.]
MEIMVIYLGIVNLVGFGMMGIDKKRAIRGAWRISEASLFMAALVGGALGCTLGMHIFHHKTRHWYFRFGMPAIFMVQILLGILLLRFIL